MRLDDENGLEMMNLSKEEAKAIKDCKRGKTESSYIQRKKNLEKKWFKTIQDFAGPNLQSLLNMVPCTYSGGGMDRLFYNALGGEKTPEKKYLMNKLLCLCGVKWVITRGKDVGRVLESSTFVAYMKLLFYVFEEKGIRFNWEEDFNGEGEFHGVMIDMWDNIMKENPEFGTGSKEAQFMDDSDNRVRNALKTKVLDIENNAVHLQWLVYYIMGRYCGLRGSKEHDCLRMENIHIGHYGLHGAGVSNNELRGRRFGGVYLPFSKTHKLSFSKAKAQSKEKGLLTFPEVFDVLNPVEVLIKYLSHMHPEANGSAKFYCKPASEKQRLEFKIKFNRDVWYLPGIKSPYNIGENQLPKMSKQLAKICGAPNWEKCTGHGLRKLLITILVEAGLPAVDVAALARHNSLNSQQPYAKNTAKRKHNQMLALQDSSTTGSSHKKKASRKEKKSQSTPVDVVVPQDVPSSQEQNGMIQQSSHPTGPVMQSNCSNSMQPWQQTNLVQPAPVHRPPPPVQQQPIPMRPRMMQNGQSHWVHPSNQGPQMMMTRPATPQVTGSFSGFPPTPEFQCMEDELGWRRDWMAHASQYFPSQATVAPIPVGYQQPPPRNVRLAQSNTGNMNSGSRRVSNPPPPPPPAQNHYGTNGWQQQQCPPQQYGYM